MSRRLPSLARALSHVRVARRAAALAAALISAPVALKAEPAETLMKGLDYPWALAVHGDVVFLTEKAGTIATFHRGRLIRLSVESAVPVLDDRGGGLLGLALRPDFASTARAVAYQHHGTPDARLNRVIEIELRGDGWHETRALLEGIPGHPLYNGGRVAFGPDGMLYVTTGWTERRDLPQDHASLAGKILRLTPDGAVPDDNPFPGSPVWSLGHRNPQGLAWDDRGRLYASEHGQSGHDEINRIEKGANYGWPAIQGDGTAEGMRAPLIHSGGATWAPSGLAWADGRLWLSSLRQGAILIFSPKGERLGEIEVGERIRDLAPAPGGLLAITTERSPRRDGPSADRLLRIAP